MPLATPLFLKIAGLSPRPEQPRPVYLDLLCSRPTEEKRATLVELMGYFQTPWHIVLLLLIALLLFGGKRLPEIGKSLGHGMREFKDAVTGHSSDDDAQPELPPAEPTETTATATTATPAERETV
jgi:sec-independent protein translocase protein TatA